MHQKGGAVLVEQLFHILFFGTEIHFGLTQHELIPDPTTDVVFGNGHAVLWRQLLRYGSTQFLLGQHLTAHRNERLMLRRTASRLTSGPEQYHQPQQTPPTTYCLY